MIALLCTVRECATPLVREERRYVCANGHSFDVSRSGYVNLLQPQDRRSKTPGDTPEAVNARRRFLDRGFAQPLVQAIVDLLPLATDEPLLDAGCGEGHHLGTFRRAYQVEGHGVDISIPAIDAAARRHRDCLFIVANADRLLPYADASFAAVASITARMNAEEFRRVLPPGGRLLVAIPGADDLVELREAVLGGRVERDRVERTIELFPGFTLVQHELAKSVATLDRAAMIDVMTSSYRGLRPREREKLETMREMDVTLARDLLLFART